MGYLSRLRAKQELPLDIVVRECWFDHCFQGKAVLPAVEAVQHLAASTLTVWPQAYVWTMLDAVFERFLVLGPEMTRVQAVNRVEEYEDGRIVATLVHKQWLPALRCSRSREHVRVSFCLDAEKEQQNAASFRPNGKDDFSVPQERVYTELVPFRKAYHNVVSSVVMSEHGARAMVRAAPHQVASEPLGSPFPLDAALHVACVWGQRYAGIVGFPVGFKRRSIQQRTRTNELYNAWVKGREIRGKEFVVDIRLEDAQGLVFEVLTNVVMRDVSGERIQPPPWILADAP